MTRINLTEKDKDLLSKLGIELEPGMEKMGSRYVALGKVLQTISKLDENDALFVLSEARKAVSRSGQIAENTINKEKYVYPIGYVLDVVSRRCGVSISDLQGRSRSAEVAEARMIACYILRMFNIYTLEEIGHALGSRTPATVLHGFQTIARQVIDNSNMRKLIDRIKVDLQ
jgi:chromosomal replication initiation ATPase DnaA